MSVTPEQVKKLREMSGAPMMECKRALDEAQGEMEQAFTVLRKRGLATAAKKAGRETSEGVVGSYIHAGGKIGVLVEVNCETDFVARHEEFQQLAHDLAMQICATDPRFIRKEDVTAEVLQHEKEVLRSQAAAIVRYRAEHGDFKSVEDLKKVPGVDAAKIEARKDRLSFAPSAQ